MSKGLRWVVLAVSVLVIIAAAGYLVLARSGVGPGSSPTVVKGLVGSEKAPFFADPEVQRAFEQNGFRLEIDTAGSRSMLATVDTDPEAYDFYFPSSAPVADALAADLPNSTQTPAFQTPMVVLTFADLEPILQANGLSTPAQGASPASFNLKAYQDKVAAHATWQSLDDNAAYNPNKAILVTTTDPVRSNSGLMFASLNAYVANNNAILNDGAQVPAIANQIRPLFDDQGYMERSTEGPFENYLATGKQSTPLLLAYESQLLSRLLAKSPAVTDTMRVLYPEPGMFSRHVVVSHTGPGDQVAQLLARDPELMSLEAGYGFRPQHDPTALPKAVEAAGLPALPSVDNAIEPSRYDILNALAEDLAPNAAREATPTPDSLTDAPEVQGS